jgi:hypothetical protein
VVSNHVLLLSPCYHVYTDLAHARVVELIILLPHNSTSTINHSQPPTNVTKLQKSFTICNIFANNKSCRTVGRSELGPQRQHCIILDAFDLGYFSKSFRTARLYVVQGPASIAFFCVTTRPRATSPGRSQDSMNGANALSRGFLSPHFPFRGLPTTSFYCARGL